MGTRASASITIEQWRLVYEHLARVCSTHTREHSDVSHSSAHSSGGGDPLEDSHQDCSGHAGGADAGRQAAGEREDLGGEQSPRSGLGQGEAGGGVRHERGVDDG